MITTSDPIAVSFPVPDLGDIFVRDIVGGKEERAMVLSIVGSDQDWEATVFTSRGREVINGERDRKRPTDFHPSDFIWDERFSCMKPRGSVWEAKARCFKKPEEVLPELEDLPLPLPSEKRGRWRGRIKREFPILCDHVDAETLLEAAWAAHEAKMAATLSAAASEALGRELAAG